MGTSEIDFAYVCVWKKVLDPIFRRSGLKGNSVQYRSCPRNCNPIRFDKHR